MKIHNGDGENMKATQKQERFLAQSYADAYRDYVFSCENKGGSRWDYIVLTAANESQADAYRVQIDKRRKAGRLPQGTELLVIPDYKNERVGSGGATLNVIRVIAEKSGMENVTEKKILVIHSGGDSKRIPQYSACGKIFSMVPRELKSNAISTIFDELLIAAAGIPNRVGNGIMIFPSDTEMVMNPLQIDLKSCDAAALSMKATVGEGKEHGVFKQAEKEGDGDERIVSRFLHKQPEQYLRECGAVDRNDNVDIDTGCIWLAGKVVKSLVGLITLDGQLDIQKFEKFVNAKVCLNFYADFVYPLAKDGTLEEYLEEAPETGFSPELAECRRIIWDMLHDYKLLLVRMVPARYIHFGMTNEMYNLLVWQLGEYEYLGWQKRLVTNAASGCVYNSVIDKNVVVPKESFIENSVIGKDVVIGTGTILSNLNIVQGNIPENTVLHGMKLWNGRYVCRIYGREDNPKAAYNAKFLNGSIEALICKTGSRKEDILGENVASIWDAKIYPVCTTFDEAVKQSIVIYKILADTASKEEILKWKGAEKQSLHGSFLEADVNQMIAWQEKIKYKVCLENLVENVFSGSEIKGELKNLDFLDREVCHRMAEDIASIGEKEKFPNNMRAFLLAGEICKKYRISDGKINFEALEDKAYVKIKESVENEVFGRFEKVYGKKRFVRDMAEVELPVRVNFCGSPSDAAPYCMEHGGTMIDGTLLLKGKRPIRVTARRLEKPELWLASRDLGLEKCFTDANEIRSCDDPFDPFALHKAVLLATGFVPAYEKNITLEDFVKNMGGGIYIETSVDVPKGSGLGTSSIIAAAMMKALYELVGIDATDEMVYAQVFLAEQLMTTGGGWQDQVGGLRPGIKYFTSKPGKYQRIEVETLELGEDVKQGLNERFALIFSGQRRLARNVLREEMNQCIRNDRAALESVKKIQELCAIMRFYLQRGEITEFAHCISSQFELVKNLDKGATNTCIEYIFDVCDDLIDGKSICGAGGGGFLQVILKEGVTKDDLKKRISEAFTDCGVEVWDCELLFG